MKPIKNNNTLNLQDLLVKAKSLHDIIAKIKSLKQQEQAKSQPNTQSSANKWELVYDGLLHDDQLQNPFILAYRIIAIPQNTQSNLKIQKVYGLYINLEAKAEKQPWVSYREYNKDNNKEKTQEQAQLQFNSIEEALQDIISKLHNDKTTK